MTMSAAASSVMVVVAASVSTSLATFAFTMMMSASAATSGEKFYQMLYLIFCSLTIFYHLSSEVECSTCERVVGIYGNTIFFNLDNLCHKMVLLIIHQSDYCTLVDIVVVEMSVDSECLTSNLMYTLWLVFAKSF